MNAENFCYWLQSQFEFARAGGVDVNFTEAQTLLIEDHLKLVFKKETPVRTSLDPRRFGIAGDQNLGIPQAVC